MGREIKFRVWDKKQKQMIPHSKLFRLDTSNEVPFLPLLEKFTSEYEVMQFTGLHDKNGKEIFEGDLVLNHRNAHSKEILQVKWQEGESKQADDGIWWTHKKPGFVFERINPGMHTVYVAEKDFEVIGNIFENEDLLS